jgi:hypothetical protein
VKIVLDPLLTKAARYAKRGRYDAAIRLLEPEVTRYRGFFSYYYLLGVLCLRSGDFSGALTYLRLAREVKMHDPSVLLGLAVLHLRRRETDRAADFYLEVLDSDEHNKIAKKALKIIRKFAGTDHLIVWIETGKYHQLYPALPSVPPSVPQILLRVFCVLAFCIVSTGILARFNIITLPKLPPGIGSRDARNGFVLSALDWEERAASVQIEGMYRYVLSKTQVLDYYEEARSLFNKRHDEKAKVALNRILESNASESVKNKAHLLISYMDVPGFDTLQDRFTYSEVIREPQLYQGCYVIWRGVAANLDIQQNATTFNFLVGYDNRVTLEGIVSVTFDFAVPINPEQPLEVLGKVMPVMVEKGIAIKVQGIALHQIQSTGR